MFSGTEVPGSSYSRSRGASAPRPTRELMFGTVDCYLLLRPATAAGHAIDATNASRNKLLFYIHPRGVGHAH